MVMRKSPVTIAMVNEYLDDNSCLGLGNGYTLNTWLTYKLHGKAKLHSDGYKERMLYFLRLLESTGDACVAFSKRNRFAWYRTQMW